MLNKQTDKIDVKHLNEKVFLSGSEPDYLTWRAQKLAHWGAGISNKIVHLPELGDVRDEDVSALMSQCQSANMVLYEAPDHGSRIDEKGLKGLRCALLQLCARMGLSHAEKHRSQGDGGVVAIEMNTGGVGAGYIPYTDKKLSWHTDGYYNAPENRIKGMVLHCVHDASEGGVNALLDPDIAYIRLRDADPDFAKALFHPETMIIPENTDTRSDYRPASIGPVFYLDATSGALNMRYSARSRSVIWREDRATSEARLLLGQILENDPFIIRHKLKPGQGIISNNILHNRTAFKNAGDINNKDRLLYRLRFHQRVQVGTEAATANNSGGE